MGGQWARGRRFVVLGEQGKWLGVLGPEMRIVEMRIVLCDRVCL